MALRQTTQTPEIKAPLYDINGVDTSPSPPTNPHPYTPPAETPNYEHARPMELDGVGPQPYPHQPPPMQFMQYHQPPPTQMSQYAHPGGQAHQFTPASYPQQVQYPPQTYGQMPQPGYPGGLPQQARTGPLTAVPLASLSAGAAPVQCPSCGHRGMTKITFVMGNTTHVWAAGLFCLTLCLFPIPYLISSMKDVEHRCENCGLFLATWHRSGRTDVHVHA